MNKPKTDESVKSGLQIEAGGIDKKNEDKEKSSASYDKDYESESYTKEEEDSTTQYDKNADEEAELNKDENE